MTDAQSLLSAFAEAWEAGLRPDVEQFVTAAPAEHQAELADALAPFLCQAPVPRYDDATLEELESSQPVREAERAFDGRAGAWPLLLPALRRQNRLTRWDVARRLADELGFAREHQRVHQHLHAMEYGTADPFGVSRTVLVALARILGTTVVHLVWAGRVPTLDGPTTGLAPSRRGLPDPPPFSEVPSGYRRPDVRRPPQWSAVDRLFLGNDE
jgi:hypothetical protein